MPRKPGSKYHTPLTVSRGVLKHSHSENTKLLLTEGILSITLFEASNKSLHLKFCLEKEQ